MSLRRGIPVLAAVMALAGFSTPAAYAAEAISPGGGIQGAAVAHSRSGGSTDWALIGVGTAGGIALLGAGVATTRHRRRDAARAAGVAS